MKVYFVDTFRRWGELLTAYECEDISQLHGDRVTRATTNDMLIIHTSQGTSVDRDYLSKNEQGKRPRLILVSGGPKNQISQGWKDIAGAYGASILASFPYFKHATELQDLDRARFVDIISAKKYSSDNLKEKSEIPASLGEVLSSNESILSILSALRFWIDRNIDVFRSADNFPAVATLSGRPTSLDQETLRGLLTSALNDISWSTIFSGALSHHFSNGHWLKIDGSANDSLETIVGPTASLQAAMSWARVKEPSTSIGGAIRLLYELAVGNGALTHLNIEHQNKITFAIMPWTPESWKSLLQVALSEITALESFCEKIYARADFTHSVLIPNDEERSILNHNSLRQDVLQRLIHKDVPGQLSSFVEDNLKPERLNQLAKLLSECDHITATRNVIEALSAWRPPESSSSTDVYRRLTRLFARWQDSTALKQAALTLKIDEVKRLERAGKALSYMDTLIGSQAAWDKHLSLPPDEKQKHSVGFWRESMIILECLHHWHAAPSRIFDFYDEN